mgnify:CR=1 FL=1
MNTALWSVAGLLAVLFSYSGGSKLVGGKVKIAANPQMGWAQDFTDRGVRGIGLAELLGGLGLLLPPVFQLWEFLTPLAGLGLAAVMAGAVVTHQRRNEAFIPALVLGALALFIAVGRLWIVPF